MGQGSRGDAPSGQKGGQGSGKGMQMLGEEGGDMGVTRGGERHPSLGGCLAWPSGAHPKVNPKSCL